MNKTRPLCAVTTALLLCGSLIANATSTPTQYTTTEATRYDLAVSAAWQFNHSAAAAMKDDSSIEPGAYISDSFAASITEPELSAALTDLTAGTTKTEALTALCIASDSQAYGAYLTLTAAHAVEGGAVHSATFAASFATDTTATTTATG